MTRSRKFRSRLVAAAVAAGALAAVTAAAPAEARGIWSRRLNEARPCAGGARQGGLDIIGLVGEDRLACYREDRPDRGRDLGRLRGLGRGEALVGIDFRVPFTDAAGVTNNVPAGGTLYGLTRQGGVYSIDLPSRTATRKAQMDMALEGTAFGIDFNPTVDRLRVVSDTGQNLRVNVDTGATLRDTNLVDDTGAPATAVTAVAYTNNDTDPATATTLYDIDTADNVLSIQNPPNAGRLMPVGALTVDAEVQAGFDLYSVIGKLPGSDVPTTVDLKGFAVLRVGGRAALYRIVPFSGRAAIVGNFDRNVIDVAIPLSQ